MTLTAQEVLFFQHRVAYARDEQAYRKLFYHFHPSLFRFTCKLTQNAEVSDEVVSDVMMKVWLMGTRLAQVDKLNLYLFTAVKNSGLSYLQRQVTGPHLDAMLPESLCDKDDPENKMICSEIEKQLEAAVRSLPPQCQLVYRLIKEEAFSYKEVCTILQVSQNTVETHMRIAFKKIRTALDNYLHHK